MVYSVTLVCFHFCQVMVRGGGAAPKCDLDGLFKIGFFCIFLSSIHSLSLSLSRQL